MNSLGEVTGDEPHRDAVTHSVSLIKLQYKSAQDKESSKIPHLSN